MKKWRDKDRELKVGVMKGALFLVCFSTVNRWGFFWVFFFIYGEKRGKKRYRHRTEERERGTKMKKLLERERK